MTRLKDVALQLQTAISQFANDGVTQLWVYRDNFLIRYESERAFRSLVELLNGMINAEEEATLDTLQPLILFLSNRYDMIRETDSLYNHTPLTLANRACLYLANTLSPLIDVPRYDLLYPHLKTANLPSHKGTLNQLEPWEFILADDGTPVDVFSCLKPLIEKTATDAVLRHTVKLGELNLEESQRVIYHTGRAFETYSNLDNEETAVLLEAWQAPIAPQEVQPDCSYGEAGLLRQKQRIGITSLDALADYLKSTADRSQWGKVLCELAPKEQLKSLILPHPKMTMVEEVKKISNYRKDDPLYNRAVIYCFVALYIQERQAQEKYKTTLGQLSLYSANYVGGYAKEDKIAAADHYLKFLLTNDPLSQWEDYFKRLRLEKHIAPLKASMVDFTAELPPIVAQASALANPDAFSPPRKSYFSFG